MNVGASSNIHWSIICFPGLEGGEEGGKQGEGEEEEGVWALFTV